MREGDCSKGERCYYAHGEAQKRKLPTTLVDAVYKAVTPAVPSCLTSAAAVAQRILASELRIGPDTD